MATQKRNALGRGLDALLSMDDVKTEGSSSINEIELAKITVNPNQPRREFDETALQELADSIAEIGIIQPITLRKLSDDEYQIIAGERRYRASQRAGLKTIPAYIRTADDENMMEMALIENIQREDLNAVEIALAYQHLLDQYELTQERLSERIGKKRTTIANYLRLLKLPAPIQMALQNKQLDTIVVNGGAADVDAVFAGHLRHKLFLLAGQGVENLHKNSPSCRANKSRSRTSQSRFADLRKQRSKKAPDVIQSAVSHRRRFLKSRFHFCLSLNADNGGCRAAILPSRFPAACCPGALHTRCCKQAPSQRPVLSVQLTFALLCPGKRIFPDTSVL